eukprot:TRINITY_DN66112_c2_g1_i2.p1 TRINITY_DN66112_c2_g1~~TRINITY_DN66112_c2_g1_i2.p1  ORF type:complete len:1107 (-),score=137.53 TRINITY_DN66112_c2_g1_i2:878-3703(-)
MRRHSFCCLRDVRSMNLFVSNKGRKKLIESKGWGFAAQRTDESTQQFKDALHHTLQKKINDLEAQLAKSRQHASAEVERRQQEVRASMQELQQQNEALRSETGRLTAHVAELDNVVAKQKQKLDARKAKHTATNEQQLQQLSECLHEKNSLQEENANLQRLNETLTQQLSRLDGVMAHQTQRIAEVNEDALARNEEKVILEHNNHKLTQMNATLNESVNKFEARVHEQDAIIKQLSARLAHYESNGKLSEEQLQAERQRQEALEQELAESSAALREVTERLTEAHSQLDTTRRQLMQQETDHMAKTIALENIEGTSRKLKNREQRLATDLHSRTKELGEYSARLAQTEQELTDTRRQLMLKCAELQDKAEALDEYNGMLTSVEGNLNAVSGRLERAENEITDKAVELKGKELENEQLKKNYCGVLREKMGFDSYYDSKRRNRNFVKKILTKKRKDPYKPWEKFMPTSGDVDNKVERDLALQRGQIHHTAKDEIQKQIQLEKQKRDADQPLPFPQYRPGGRSSGLRSRTAGDSPALTTHDPTSDLASAAPASARGISPVGLVGVVPSSTGGSIGASPRSEAGVLLLDPRGGGVPAASAGFNENDSTTSRNVSPRVGGSAVIRSSSNNSARSSQDGRPPLPPQPGWSGYQPPPAVHRTGSPLMALNTTHNTSYQTTTLGTSADPTSPVAEFDLPENTSSDTVTASQPIVMPIMVAPQSPNHSRTHSHSGSVSGAPMPANPPPQPTRQQPNVVIAVHQNPNHSASSINTSNNQTTVNTSHNTTTTNATTLHTPSSATSGTSSSSSSGSSSEPTSCDSSPNNRSSTAGSPQPVFVHRPDSARQQPPPHMRPHLPPPGVAHLSPYQTQTPPSRLTSSSQAHSRTSSFGSAASPYSPGMPQHPYQQHHGRASGHSGRSSGRSQSQQPLLASSYDPYDVNPEPNIEYY